VDLKNLKKKFSVEKNHKRVSGSEFEWATSIGAPSRKLKSFNCRLAVSTTGGVHQ
jgi:hypothetical protein